MFRVDNIKKSSETLKTKSTKGISLGENFADYLKTGDINNKNEVNTTSSLTATGAIFAAQMVDDDEENK